MTAAGPSDGVGPLYSGAHVTPSIAIAPSSVLAEAIVYKGTTLPAFVVRRQCQLKEDGFFTFQADKDNSKKWWQLHARCSLEPAEASQIRCHERHLRKAGPIRTLAAYARDRNVLKLYCFKVVWPEGVAPPPGSTAELCFESAPVAASWHQLIRKQLSELRLIAGGSSSSLVLGSTRRGSLMAEDSMGDEVMGFYPTRITSPASSHESSGLHRADSVGNIVGGSGPPPMVPCSSYREPPSLYKRATAAEVVPANGVSSSSSSSPEHYLGPAALCRGEGAPVLFPPGRSDSPSLGKVPQPHLLAHPPVDLDVVSSSSSAAAAAVARLQKAREAAAAAKGCHSDVLQQQGDGRTMFLVPYKHSNGMAVYYRQTSPGEGLTNASGEYLLSTVIQASPKRCVDALMKPHAAAASSGAVLSTATSMELLQDEGDMQVWHMLFTPAGATGLAASLVAPREAFLHQVLTTYQEGLYNVLYSSIPEEDIKPAWRQAAAARTQRATRLLAASHPSLAALPGWRRPVPCRLTGAFTFGALEGRGERDSPLTLVTAVLQADFGGWLGAGCCLHTPSRALGLQEFLVDRMLMRVMVLKEVVEHSRFRTKPFQLLQQEAAHEAAEAAPAAHEGAEAQQQQEDGHARSAGAAAAAAAARMASAAARDLAAHMTDPQHLWRTKQGAYQQQPGLPTPGGSSSSSSSQGAAASVVAASLRQQAALQGQWGSCFAAAVAPAADAGARCADLDQQQKQLMNGHAPAPAAAGFVVTGVTADDVFEDVFEDATSCASSLDAAAEELEGSTAVASAAGRGAGAGALGGAAAGSLVALTSRTTPGGGGSISSVQAGPCPYSPGEIRALLTGTLNKKYWEAIHDGRPGDTVFAVRGKQYLKDRKKYQAGRGRYKLMAAELAATPDIVPHISRYLPSVRCTGAAFSFVVDLIIPGNPVLHLVMVFATDRHPSALGPCPDDPSDAGEEWTPFDLTMSRFLHGTDEERSSMFKLIPHVAKGSWILSQSVGTTPVIMGKKLNTNYFITDRYVELSIDVTTNPAVSYIVRMVQGATRSMVIDHAYLLEGQYAHELPEVLVGAIRFKHLDMTDFTHIQTQQELPFSPVVPGVVGR